MTRKHGSRTLGAALLLALVTGCGGGANNDMGAVFTIAGFYPNDSIGDDSGGGECQLPTQGLTGLIVPVSGTGETQGSDFGGPALAVLGLQNNLAQSWVQTERVFIDYQVIGGSVNVPSTSLPLSFTLGPGEVNPSNPPPSSSIPGNFQERCSLGLAQIPLLPSDVRAFLGFNRQQLPEPPYSMVATVRVQAHASNGKGYLTPPFDLWMEIVDDTNINPSTPSDSAPPASVEGSDEVETDSSVDGGEFEENFVP